MIDAWGLIDPSTHEIQPQRVPAVGGAGRAQVQAAGQPLPPLRLPGLPLVRLLPDGHVSERYVRGWVGAVNVLGADLNGKILKHTPHLTATKLGLDNAISVSVAHPVWQRTKPNDEMDGHTGWVFRASKDPPLASPSGFGRFACDGCVQDYVNGARTVRELYEMSRDRNGKYTVRFSFVRACFGGRDWGRGHLDILEIHYLHIPSTIDMCQVPLLWDKRLGTIVNNEVHNFIIYTRTSKPHHTNNTLHTTLQHHIQSGDILRMLNAEFNALAMNPNLDLYPADLAAKLEETEGWLHDCVADGKWVGLGEWMG